MGNKLWSMGHFNSNIVGGSVLLELLCLGAVSVGLYTIWKGEYVEVEEKDFEIANIENRQDVQHLLRGFEKILKQEMNTDVSLVLYEREH